LHGQRRLSSRREVRVNVVSQGRSIETESSRSRGLFNPAPASWILSQTRGRRR